MSSPFSLMACPMSSMALKRQRLGAGCVEPDASAENSGETWQGSCCTAWLSRELAIAVRRPVMQSPPTVNMMGHKMPRCCGIRMWNTLLKRGLTLTQLGGSRTGSGHLTAHHHLAWCHTFSGWQRGRVQWLAVPEGVQRVSLHRCCWSYAPATALGADSLQVSEGAWMRGGGGWGLTILRRLELLW